MLETERHFMRKAKLKPIPRFRSEAEECEFWESHDSTDYVDFSKGKRVQFPNLKLSTSISPQKRSNAA